MLIEIKIYNYLNLKQGLVIYELGGFPRIHRLANFFLKFLPISGKPKKLTWRECSIRTALNSNAFLKDFMH